MTVQLLTPEEAAARLRVCDKTLRALRQQGLIRYVAISKRKIFYRPEDCDAYLEACCRVEVPAMPTKRRRLRRAGNVVSFMDRRQNRIAAEGR